MRDFTFFLLQQNGAQMNSQMHNQHTARNATEQYKDTGGVQCAQHTDSVYFTW